MDKCVVLDTWVTRRLSDVSPSSVSLHWCHCTQSVPSVARGAHTDTLLSAPSWERRVRGHQQRQLQFFIFLCDLFHFLFIELLRNKLFRMGTTQVMLDLQSQCTFTEQFLVVFLCLWGLNRDILYCLRKLNCNTGYLCFSFFLSYIITLLLKIFEHLVFFSHLPMSLLLLCLSFLNLNVMFNFISCVKLAACQETFLYLAKELWFHFVKAPKSLWLRLVESEKSVLLLGSKRHNMIRFTWFDQKVSVGALSLKVQSHANKPVYSLMMEDTFTLNYVPKFIIMDVSIVVQ